MSYTRFGDDSDVYVFLAVDGQLECCGCKLKPESESFYSTARMIEHLDVHRAAGHAVPDYAYERLREEAVGIDEFIREGGA